jgi:hypothetical protein
MTGPESRSKSFQDDAMAGAQLTITAIFNSTTLLEMSDTPLEWHWIETPIAYTVRYEAATFQVVSNVLFFHRMTRK